MRGRLKNTRALLKDQAGSLTVEFVALTPMLLVSLIFALDFGRTLWAYDTVVRDLRDAVRYVSRASLNCGSNHTQAENLAQYGATSSTGLTKHFPWNNGTATFSYSTSNPSGTYNVPSPTVVTMTATVPITLLAAKFLTFFNYYTDPTPGKTNPIVMPSSVTVSYQARCIGN
jgi:Flp pilus assembly protein TadG